MAEKKVTALITGAHGGIGFEVCRELAELGFQIFLSSRNSKKGNAAVKQLRNKNLDVHYLPMDVTSPKSIQSATKLFFKKAKTLDVLINNAAILLDGNTPFLKTKKDVMVKTFLTNTIGPVLVIQAFLPFMKKSEAPRIINVSSETGSLSEMETYSPAYSLSKTALNATTVQFSNLLREQNIAVNSVCPGWVRTEMGGRRAPRSVEQGADSIVWLATDAHQTLTGQCIRDRQEIDW